MLDLSFDLADTLDVKARLSFDPGDGRLGYLAQPRHAFRGEDLHLEPFLKAVFFGPDAAHRGTGVTGNHKFRTVRHKGLGVRGRLTPNALPLTFSSHPYVPTRLPHAPTR